MGPFSKKTTKEELSEAPQVEELLKNLEFHKTLQSIITRIAAAASLRDILVDIKEDIRNLFKIHILTIYLIDRPKNEIFTQWDDGREIRFPINYSTLAGCVAQKKRMVHIADAYNEHEIRKIHDLLAIDRTMDKKTGIPTGQIIAAPIMHDHLVLGVLEIMNKKGGDDITDYHQIFLDEIIVALSKALFAHFSFAEIKQRQGAKYQTLIESGLITSIDLDNVLKEATESGEEIASILMARYAISKTDIGGALASHYSCPFVAYSDDLPIPRDLLIGIEKYTLLNMMWVPIKVVKGIIHVAIDDPSDHIRKSKIEDILETKSIQYDVALASDILRYINRFYYSAEEAIPENGIPQADRISKQPPPRSLDTQDDRQTARPEVRQTSPPTKREPSLSTDRVVHQNTSRATPYRQPITPTGPGLASSVPPKNTIEPAGGKPSERPQPIQPKSGDGHQTDSPSLEPLSGIVYQAYSRHASDIHLEPDPVARQVTLRMRIDGQFSGSQTISLAEYETLARQIKTLSHCGALDTPTLQHGKLSLKRPSGDDLHLRVSLIPTRSGMEDIVIHLSNRLRKIPLELLGLSEKAYTDMVTLLRQPRGLILITGPVESGVTTTLHACLDNINSQEVKIWTAEDPVEIVQAGLRQVQIDPQKGWDFPAVLHSFLQADPDVMMVSRIDDPATAKLSMKASVKGLLVLGSLWAESIPDAIERCLEMAKDSHLLFADAILAIVQQRLIKTLCPKCKEKYHPGQEEYIELSRLYGKENFERLHPPYSNALGFFRPKGCPDCRQTGYLGRTCISETMIFTSQIKRMIRRKESPALIYEEAVKSGMTTLMQDGITKVIQGLSDSRHVRLSCLG